MSKTWVNILSILVGASVGIVCAMLINFTDVPTWATLLLFLFMFALWFGGQVMGFLYVTSVSKHQ